MDWYREIGLSWSHPDVVISSGPDRIYDNDPKPDLPRRPVGFRPIEVEPLLWEGDNA